MASYCAVCHRFASRFERGPGGRPNARCPSCQSLERHRFLAMVLESLESELSEARIVLDVAPMKQVARRLQEMSGRTYVSMDLDPAADGRLVLVQADLTALPFKDAALDFVLCYHVLEHVPDDKLAMRELGRVLSEHGLAVIQVPWRPDDETDEGPSAPVEERVRRFGQADHVRWYGRDFDSRLQGAGLATFRFTPADVLPEHAMQVLGVSAIEPVWLACARPFDVTGPNSTSGLLRRIQMHVLNAFTAQVSRLPELEAELATLAEEAASWHQEAERWRRNYQRLRGRWPVRAAAAARRIVGFR